MKARQSKRRQAKKRAIRRRKSACHEAVLSQAWLTEDGCQMLVPGTPTPELLDKLSQNFQEQLRRSPLWKELIQQYGEERAEQILRQCRAQLA